MNLLRERGRGDVNDDAHEDDDGNDDMRSCCLSNSTRTAVHYGVIVREMGTWECNGWMEGRMDGFLIPPLLPFLHQPT